MNNRVDRTVTAAENAIKELLAEGARFSQHAVEKRAGLSNGALNYECSKYKELKKRINIIKRSQKKDCETNQKFKDEITKQSKLKNKYRTQRNELRIENSFLHAENKELLYQIFKLQQYVKEIEKFKLVDLKEYR